jgi:hypothetical protein
MRAFLLSRLRSKSLLIRDLFLSKSVLKKSKSNFQLYEKYDKSSSDFILSSIFVFLFSTFSSYLNSCFGSLFE